MLKKILGIGLALSLAACAPDHNPHLLKVYHMHDGSYYYQDDNSVWYLYYISQRTTNTTVAYVPYRGDTTTATAYTTANEPGKYLPANGTWTKAVQDPDAKEVENTTAEDLIVETPDQTATEPGADAAQNAEDQNAPSTPPDAQQEQLAPATDEQQPQEQQQTETTLTEQTPTDSTSSTTTDSGSGDGGGGGDK